jgi:tight adherence protein B
MNILLLGVAIFILSLLVIELSFYAFRIIQHPDRAAVRKRLRRSVAEETANPGGGLFKKQVLSDVPFLNRILSLLPGVERLQLTMNQANLKYTLGFLILFSMAIGLSCYLFCLFLTRNGWLALLIGIFSACLPLMYTRSKKRQRMGKFEKQLPEALALIARALRAGHAFSSGMKLAAEEFGDPLGPEFNETLDEINFGLSVADALKNLARRVDCPDLGFFVVSVILQRETGGNLAEIIEGLAHLIRERFKFRGKVRVLSAEGRLSAVILMVLPLLLATFLFVFHPKVVAPLFHDPIGRVMLWIMSVLMVLGFLMVRRIIKVEV